MQVILPRNTSKKKLFFEPLKGENELSLNGFWEFRKLLNKFYSRLESVCS